MEEKNKGTPNYWSILPAEIRYDATLSPYARLLYSDLAALTNLSGYCWASNSYFAKLYQVDKKTISTWISDLESRGHIKVVVDTLKGNSRKIWTLRGSPSVDGEVSIGKRTPYPSVDGLNITSINKKKEHLVADKSATPKKTSSRTPRPLINSHNDVVKVIEAFAKINPVAKVKYSMPTWRKGADELIVAAGGVEGALDVIDKFVKERDTGSTFLALIDSPQQLANKYSSVLQEIGKRKKDGYNVRGSGYKYQDPIIISLDEDKK